MSAGYFLSLIRLLTILNIHICIIADGSAVYIEGVNFNNNLFLFNAYMAKDTITWTTVQRRVADLVPHSRNPRSLSAQQQKELTASITKLGFAEIPAINTDNQVLAGHARLKVLIALGRGEEIIDVRIPNRTLSEKECEEYLLRSNANTGSWDFELLKAFDIEFLLDVGFTDEDLGDIWDNVLEIEEDEYDEKKSLEKAHDTDIKTGNRFILGQHVLSCGDSADESVVKALVGEERIDCIYADSPYNIGLSYDKGVGGKATYGGDVDDSKSEPEFRTFTSKTIANGLSVAKKDAHIFWWCSQSHVGMIQSVYHELGINYKRTCIWVKNGFSPTPNVAFNACYEPCLYGTVGKPYLSDKHTKFNEVLNTEVGNGNATHSDIESMIDIWLAKRLPGADYEHPTQKPLTLHERPLLRCTKIGDNVLDLFGGSGSTLLACEQLKRKAFLVEKNPIFCQLIINRYEQFTGNKAVKV